MFSGLLFPRARRPAPQNLEVQSPGLNVISSINLIVSNSNNFSVLSLWMSCRKLVNHSKTYELQMQIDMTSSKYVRRCSNQPEVSDQWLARPRANEKDTDRKSRYRGEVERVWIHSCKLPAWFWKLSAWTHPSEELGGTPSDIWKSFSRTHADWYMPRDETLLSWYWLMVTPHRYRALSQKSTHKLLTTGAVSWWICSAKNGRRRVSCSGTSTLCDRIHQAEEDCIFWFRDYNPCLFKNAIYECSLP